MLLITTLTPTLITTPTITLIGTVVPTALSPSPHPHPHPVKVTVQLLEQLYPLHKTNSWSIVGTGAEEASFRIRFDRDSLASDLSFPVLFERLQVNSPTSTPGCYF